MERSIYLDYAAATPVDEDAARLVAQCNTDAWANPSSIHISGMRTAEYIKKARGQVARFLACQPEEIIFTASGSEANNLAVCGLARAHKESGRHILISAIEHESVRSASAALEREGFEIDTIPVTARGEIDPREIEKRIKPSTILVSIMMVNNELGALQPIAETGKMLLKKNKERGARRLPHILFHSDACQAAAFLPLNVTVLHTDALTINSNKVYGPKGAGALYVRRGVSVEPLIYGGGQEYGLRSGTENAPGIAGFGLAVSKAETLRDKEFERISKLRAHCIKKLTAAFPQIKINGSVVSCSPHILNITLKGIDAEAAVVYLSERGIDAASGPACAQKSGKLSPTLKAIGLTAAEMKSTLRISFGRATSAEDIEQFVTTLKTISAFVYEDQKAFQKRCH